MRSDIGAESVAYRLADSEEARERAMEIGLYGLGRMGGNMVTRLARGGHRVIAGNRSPEPVQEAATHGAIASSSVEDMVKKMKPPRVLWAMVPAGDVTDHTLDEFARFASTGDVLVDGGTATSAIRCDAPTNTPEWGFAFWTSGCPAGSGDSRTATA